MANLPPFHELTRAARKAQHLTQADLARRIGCGQSAISYFENGNTGVLSDQLIERLGVVLGVERVFEESAEIEEIILEKPGTLAFCPESDCPGAWHEMVKGEHVIYPAFFEISAGPSLAHCPMCRSQLEVGCLECLTSLTDGAAFCAGCGTMLVPSKVKTADLDFVGRMQARYERHAAVRSKCRTLPATRLRNHVRG